MKKLILIITMIFVLSACKNIDFGDYNKNPLGPNEIEPVGLFSGGVLNYFNNSGRSYLSKPGFYVQWMTQNQYTSEMQYADAAVNWSPWFIGVLSNFKQNLDYLQANYEDSKWNGLGGVDNLIAVNKIMYAFVFKHLTDTYGSIPYSEALNPDILAPKYDNQIAIYTDPEHGLIKMLQDARDMLSPGAYPIAGDVVFNGNASKWRKLANSLIMNFALQLSEVNDANIQSYIKAAFNDALADGPMTSVSHDAWINFYDYSRAYQNPWTRLRKRDYFLSLQLTDALKGVPRSTVVRDRSPIYNHSLDFRLFIIADDPSADGKNYIYHSRLTPDENGEAQFSSRIWNPNAPLPFFLSAWTYLDRAEAAARGWSEVGDFDNLLAQAISNSYKTLSVHYGLDISSYADDFAAARVADANDPNYGDPNITNNKLEVVAEEKWVSYFPSTFLGWSQWKRLDIPVLIPHSSPYNAANPETGQVIPVRYKYPNTESTQNPEGYQAGVNDLLPAVDANTSHVPWDR